MLFIWHYLLGDLCLTFFIQHYCCFCYFLLNVAIVHVIFCLMLLVWCCYSFCCFLLDIITFLVTPCLMLLLFLLLLVRCYYSFYCSLFDIATFRYLLDVAAPLVICFKCGLFKYLCAMPWCCCSFVICFLLDVAIPILPILDWFPLLFFCRCEKSYPTSSFLG